MKGFPYPLTTGALAEFCHPRLDALRHPARLAGEVVAGNGWLLLRCHRGYWLDGDFPEAGEDLRRRLEKVAWGRFPKDAPADAWRALDDIRGDLVAAGWRDPWRARSCPVWQAGGVPVRLDLLQLVSRLPRCEVWPEATTATDPLWFRFSGGMGALARAGGTPSRHLFRPAYCPLDGQRLARPTRPAPNFGPPPPPEPEIEGWPPAEGAA